MKIIEKIKAKQKDLNANAPVTIAFFGDSVTQGCFELYKTSETSFLPEVRVEEGYHAKLRSIFQMLYPMVPINMIYGGISGGNTEVALGRVERDVCAFNPDLTIVCFGLNDCCAGADKVDNYVNSLKGIFEKLRACGSEIIFMTPNIIPNEVSPDVVDEFTKGVYESIVKMNAMDVYVDAARELCAKENIPLCDCYKIWKRLNECEVNTTRLLSNRINHPTHEMHWLFAFKLAEMIFMSEN